MVKKVLIQGKVKGDGGLMRTIVINRLKSVENTILFRCLRSLLFGFLLLRRNGFEISSCKAFEDVEKTGKRFGVQNRTNVTYVELAASSWAFCM